MIVKKDPSVENDAAGLFNSSPTSPPGRNDKANMIGGKIFSMQTNRTVYDIPDHNKNSIIHPAQEVKEPLMI